MSLSTIDILPAESANGCCIFLLTLRSDDHENRFDDATINKINSCLDIVENYIISNPSKRPFALVTWGGEGKIFSNGLSIQHLSHLGQQCSPALLSNPSEHDRSPPGIFLKNFGLLMARFVSIGIPTVAAVNGHAYAGGCIISLAHDKRVMRCDNGRYKLCLIEILLNMGIPKGLNKLCQSKIPMKLYRDMALFGRAVTAEEGFKEGIIDEIVPVSPTMDDVKRRACSHAIELAKKIGNNNDALNAIKEEAYRDALTQLRDGSLGYAGPVFVKLLCKI